MAHILKTAVLIKWLHEAAVKKTFCPGLSPLGLGISLWLFSTSIYSHKLPSLNTSVLCFHNKTFEALQILVSKAHMTMILFGENSKITNGI